MKSVKWIAFAALWAAAVGCESREEISSATSMVVQAQRTTWQSPFGPGEEIRSTNYRIFVTTRNAALRQNLPGFMEAAYSHYVELTGLPRANGPQRLDLYVLADRQQWAHLTTHHFGEQQSKVYLQLEAGGYMSDGVCVLWDIRVVPTLSVASHEGLHQFFHHRLKDRIPMWAEEGLCSNAEGFELLGNAVRFTPADNPSRFITLRNTLGNGHWTPLEKLLPMDAGDAISRHPSKAIGYYAQVWSLILFIRSTPAYREGFQQMLRDAQDGKLVTALGMHLPARSGRQYNRTISVPAFRHYITNDLASFEKDWRRYALKLANLSQ